MVRLDEFLCFVSLPITGRHGACEAGCPQDVDTDLDTKRFATAWTGRTGRTCWTEKSLVSGTQALRRQRPGRLR